VPLPPTDLELRTLFATQARHLLAQLDGSEGSRFVTSDDAHWWIEVSEGDVQAVRLVSKPALALERSAHANTLQLVERCARDGLGGANRCIRLLRPGEEEAEEESLPNQCARLRNAIDTWWRAVDATEPAWLPALRLRSAWMAGTIEKPEIDRRLTEANRTLVYAGADLLEEIDGCAAEIEERLANRLGHPLAAQRAALVEAGGRLSGRLAALRDDPLVIAA
jgi:hypothetical protein